ncbi:hypothetical protein [Micromonospora sp. CPCC 206061]|uniref:hypothetical protein n=1 Tax=Micromonospora sp. CPCC 206061 TaxID=3122410 RepID=UPI002FEFA8B8
MGARVSRRWLLNGALLAMFAAPQLLTSPASAAPANTPTAVTIAGDGMTQPITVPAADKPELFNAVLGQVSWLKGKGQSSSPKPDKLGPKYTVTVLVGDAAKQTYDLYPLATGGPRAFRPAKQPDKKLKTTAAWFYGRLTMSETLRAAGVPLPEQPETLHGGGVGGGDRVFDDDTLNPGRDIDKLLTDLRQMLLLNGAVVVIITLGLAGIALLVRRRTR